MQRRNIIDSRRQARSGLGAGASAPAATGTLDVLTANGYTPRVGLSLSHRLRDDYTGALFCVRRADNVEADIPVDPLTGLWDNALLVAHCGASNGFLRWIYDQSGNARHFGIASAAAQPKIYDGVTGPVLRGGLLVATTDGGAGGSGNGDWIEDATSQIGLTGSPSNTIFVGLRSTDNATYNRAPVMLGGNSSFSHTLAIYTNGNLGFSFGAGDVAIKNRVFTPAIAASGTFQYWIGSVAQAAFSSSTTLRQNGAMLAQSSTAYVAITSSINGAQASLGATPSGFLGLTGEINTLIVAAGYVRGAALESLAELGGDLVELAEGSAPAPADLSHLPRYIYLLGQSNAGNFIIPGTEQPVTDSYDVTWLSYGVSTTNLAEDWAPPSGPQFLEAVSRLSALDSNIPIYATWLQGENDASNPAWYGAYYANFIAFDAALTAAIGRQIRWLDVLLHASKAGGFAPGSGNLAINDAKLALNSAPELAGRHITLDPTPYGSLADGTHYDVPMRVAIAPVFMTTIKTEWPTP